MAVTRQIPRRDTAAELDFKKSMSHTQYCILASANMKTANGETGDAPTASYGALLFGQSEMGLLVLDHYVTTAVSYTSETNVYLLGPKTFTATRS